VDRWAHWGTPSDPLSLSAGHWYCQDMMRDEAYVFRSFDSAQAEPVPHSAFVNESCPASAPPRASVEVRVFAFYED
jgi:hypothetical protein